MWHANGSMENLPKEQRHRDNWEKHVYRERDQVDHWAKFGRTRAEEICHRQTR